MTNSIPDRAHLLTIEEACQALGIGRSKTYQLLTSGELASIKIGSRRLVAVTSITEYIRQQLHADDGSRLPTADLIEDLIALGELHSVTLGDHLFVSVESLNAYSRNHTEAAS